MSVDAFLMAVLFEPLKLLVIELQLEISVSRLKYAHDLCFTQARLLVPLLIARIVNLTDLLDLDHRATSLNATDGAHNVN